MAALRRVAALGARQGDLARELLRGVRERVTAAALGADAKSARG